MVLILLLTLILQPFAADTTADGQETGFTMANDYIWPTNASTFISSTFAETRSAHFHAALDIKTWGRKGYKVFATRDGTLHRLAVGPRGYGKVVYLKHNDGTYSVYAHLLSFNDRFQQLADSVRMQDYSFEVDLTLDSLGITVNQGEVIGYTGSSGVGPPHLHFELRTPSHKPFNPLLTNLSIQDSRPPRFSGLTVEPLEIHSRVENEPETFVKKPARGINSVDFGTIKVSGPVGLGVDVFDLADRVSNAYAVYDLKLYLDNDLIFHSRVDSFSYDQTGQMFLDRVYPLLQKTGTGYQRLYKTSGNNLPFYQTLQNNGILDLKPGNYPLKIAAEDYYGNRSEAKLILNVQQNDSEYFLTDPGWKFPLKTGNSLIPPEQMESWDWHPDWIRFSKSDSVLFNVISTDPGKNYSTQYFTVNTSISLRNKPYLVIGDKNGEKIHLRRMYPSTKNLLNAADNRVFVNFPPETFYDTLSAAVTYREFSADSVRIDIYPANQPVRDDYELYLRLSEQQKQDTTLAFYSYNKRKDRLQYIPTYRGERLIKGESSKLGTFYMVSDTLPPEISNPRIYRREDGHWMGSVDITDNRSGIDHKKIEFYINGTRGIAEYEPENDRIHYYHPDFKPQTNNSFRVSAVDNIGNRITGEFVVE